MMLRLARADEVTMLFAALHLSANALLGVKRALGGAAKIYEISRIQRMFLNAWFEPEIGARR